MRTDVRIFLKIVKAGYAWLPRNYTGPCLTFYLSGCTTNSCSTGTTIKAVKKPFIIHEHVSDLLESFMSLCSIKGQREDRSKLWREPPSQQTWNAQGYTPAPSQTHTLKLSLTHLHTHTQTATYTHTHHPSLPKPSQLLLAVLRICC